MSEIHETKLVGIQCDYRGCNERLLAVEPAPNWSAESRAFLDDALTAGWVAHSSRSLRWLCPGDHADSAYRCKAPGTGHISYDGTDRCGSPHCNVHRRGSSYSPVHDATNRWTRSYAGAQS